MIATIQEESKQSIGAERHTPDIFARLATCSRQGLSSRGYYRASVHAIAEHFAAAFTMIHVADGASTIEESVESASNARVLWDKVAHASLLEAESSGNARARLYRIDGSDKSVVLLAVPLYVTSAGASGAIVLVTACESRSSAERDLFELEAIAAFVSGNVPNNDAHRISENTTDQSVQRAVTKASEYSGQTELAFALTNGLKSKFGCNQVALGLVSRNRVRIVSISEMDDVYPRSPGSTQIRQAMEECVDAGIIVSLSTLKSRINETSVADYRLHLQWSAAIGNATVASIPLHFNGDCIAVLSITRPKGSEIADEEMAAIASAIRAYAPALYLTTKSSRSLWAHTADSVREVVSTFSERGRIGRKIACAATIVASVWFAFGRMPYRVSAPCTIAANRMQILTAPFQGCLAESSVTSGDQVVAGQLLFRMDTKELQLQLSELESDSRVAHLEIARAVAADNLDEAALGNARLGVIQARMRTLRHQLSVSEVRAPSDGVIMSGEVAERVGEQVPMGETLAQFAPHDSRRIELNIPESQVLYLQEGATGVFATMARPGEILPFTIERIDPTSKLVDGNSVFLATAVLQDIPSWMRVGMQGTATVDAGSKRVCWVSLHRLVDFVRLHCGI